MQSRLDQLFEFLKESPSDPFLKYAIATEYIKSGAMDLGLKSYQALLVEHPDYVGTYYHLGKLYEQLQNPEEAAETYRKGVLIAQKARNRHAMGELQAALNMLDGLEEDDDDF